MARGKDSGGASPSPTASVSVRQQIGGRMISAPTLQKPHVNIKKEPAAADSFWCYLKSCASCRTISFTFMRRTFVEDSFSSSFMVM